MTKEKSPVAIREYIKANGNTMTNETMAKKLRVDLNRVAAGVAVLKRERKLRKNFLLTDRVR